MQKYCNIAFFCFDGRVLNILEKYSYSVCDCVIGNPSDLIKSLRIAAEPSVIIDQSECELPVIWSQSQHSRVSFRTRKTWRWNWWLVCFLSRIFNVVAVDKGHNGLIYTMQCMVWLTRPEWINMTAFSVSFSSVNLSLFGVTTCVVSFLRPRFPYFLFVFIIFKAWACLCNYIENI